ncbi:MAG: PAS domain S-box protein [Vicinamibacteria bacterium]
MTDPDARIAELVQAIQAAEAELQQMTGGQLDAVVMPGQSPYLLRAAQERLRHSEAALREREQEQRQLAEALTVETRRLHESQAVANVGSWETNLGTLEVSWTEETYRIFEVSPAEFRPTHQGFLELVHPDDRAMVDAAFVNSHGKPEAIAIEHRIVRPDGRVKFVEERWQNFNDETGQPFRAVGTCQDITARKLADEVLRMRARQQEVIARIGLEATRATTLEGIFDFTTRAVAEALDVEMCKVLQLAPDGSHLRLVSGVGWQPGEVGVATVGVDAASQAGFTLNSAGPIFVNDFREEKRFQAPPLLVQHEVASGLSVTIPLLDKAWGVLGAHCRSVRRFDELDAQFIQSVATLLSVVIERLAAQRSLSESERRLRDAQRIAHLGSWELDIARNQLIWSDEVYRIFGVTPETFTGGYEAFLALVHPEDRERMDADHQRVLASEGVLDTDHRIVRPDGEIRHARERAELINDEHGRPVALSGTTLDITDRVQAQETRRQAEELSSAIVASSLDAIITIDHQNRILEFNPSAEAIFGWPKAAVLGRDLSDVIIPERLRESHRRGMARYLATGEKRAMDRRRELPAIRADGTEIVVELNATPLSQSKPPQFTAFLRDITQSKKAADILLASEARFRALFDQAAVGMCLVSTEGKFLRTNRRFGEIVGYSAETLLKRSCLETTHPDDRAREAEITTRMLAGELQTSSWEKRYLKPDGRAVWCNLTLALIPGQADAAQQFVGVIEDITERRQSEEQLRLLETCVARLNDIVLITDAARIDDPGPRILYVNDAFVRRTGFSREEAMGKTPRLLQGPKTQRDALDRIRAALKAWRPVREELINYTKSGEEFWIEIDIVPVADAKGWLTHWVAIERDITDRKKAEAVTREIVRIQQEMAMSDVPAQTAMDMIAEHARALTNAAGGVVELVDQAEMVYTAGAGAVADKVGMRLNLESSLSGLAVKTGSVLIADDTETDPRCDRLACRKVGVRSMVVAPLRVGTEIMGVLKVMSDRPTAFTNWDVGNLQILTETLGAVIQRQRAAEKLRESEEEFRTLAEAMPQIVWISRADGWTTYFNDQWMKYTGLTLEESLGHGWSQPFHPDDRPAAEVAWQRALALLDDYELECRLRRTDGEYRWWLIRGKPLLDEAGGVLKWFGTCTDIDDLKVAELEITRTNRALKMLSTCNEVLVRAENEADLLAAFCRLSREIGGYRMTWVGYAREDAARTISFEARSGDDDGYLDKIQLSWDETVVNGQGPAGRVISTGQPVICADFETADEFLPWRELARKYGLRSVICLPLRAGDRTFGLLGLYSSEANHPGADELKLLQEMADDLAFGIGNLRAQAAKRLTDKKVVEQADLLDKATDAISVRDLEHRVVFWSRGAETIFGWSAAEALGRPTTEFLNLNSASFHAAVAAVMDKGEWTGELEKQNRAGKMITMGCRWTLVRNQSGVPESILCIETDITEKKKLEAQFLRAQRMESVGTLASGIAHDMNNILSPIMLSVELLKDAAKDEETLGLLNTLESCSQRGANLVQQLVSFARGTEGERVEINLKHLIKELQSVMKGVFPKDVEFKVSAVPDLWSIVGDSSQLHQVFLNLCVNARDAMPQGGELTITLENILLDEIYAAMHQGNKPGSYVVASVVDTGTGIPPALMAKIFEPFFTTKELGRGTGLGLSTVLGIIKAHGGFVNVYSEEGKGTQFKVFLPAQTSDTQSEEVSGPQTGLPRGNGELILLVDDEKGIRDIAVKTLTRFGYRVLEASNGAEGVRLYVQNQKEIALVFTDVSMPIMDGTALIAALKASDPEVRILVASGLPSNLGAIKAMETGARQFISKPYTAEKLLEMIYKELHS